MKPLFIALVMGAFAMLGCQPAKSAAELDYTAKQLACVDKSPTTAEATACRNKVKADWAAKQQAPNADTVKGSGQ